MKGVIMLQKIPKFSKTIIAFLFFLILPAKSFAFSVGSTPPSASVNGNTLQGTQQNQQIGGSFSIPWPWDWSIFHKSKKPPPPESCRQGLFQEILVSIGGVKRVTFHHNPKILPSPSEPF